MTPKSKKVFFITAGVTALVVCAIILALLLNIQAVKPRIEAAASNALGMEFRIKGRLGIALFPGIGISLKDVSVRNRGAEVVAVEKMNIGLKFMELMRREVRISSVGLIKPVFSLVRYKNGTFNISTPGYTLSGRPFAVNTITISQGRFVYTDAGSRVRIEADEIEATMQNLSYRGSDNAELLKNVSFDGALRCKTLAMRNFTLTNLVMTLAGRNGLFDFNPVRMDIFDKTGKASLHVDMRRESPHYRVVATLNRFRIEELIQKISPGNIPRKSMEGTVNFTANLTARGKSENELMSSLNGAFSLNGEDLTLSSIDIDALIPKYERSQNFNLVDVGAYFLAGPFGPVLTKSYDFGNLYKESHVGKRNITKLVSIWNVKNGIAGAIDVAFATKKNRIAIKGGLDFNNSQFVGVTVAVLDKQGCAVYSQKVRGPFRKPQIEKVSIFKSITGSVSNALEDARQFIQRGKCTIFYSGSVAQPEG